jgi:hypothetical protein
LSGSIPPSLSEILIACSAPAGAEPESPNWRGACQASAEQVSLFAIEVGIIVVVVGIGLGVLTIYVFGWAPWRHEAAAEPAASA